MRKKKEAQKLNITFHNPNTDDAFVKKLIEIAAQIAKVNVEKQLLELANKEAQLHMDAEDEDWDR